MVTRQQRLIESGLLTIVDRGKTVVGIAPTKDVKEISAGETPAQKAEDTARLSQKAAAQSFPSIGVLRAAGAPLILTTSGFEAFKERQKQGRVEPAIQVRATALERARGVFRIARTLTEPGRLIPALFRGGARLGATAGAFAAGVPPQQIPPFVLGTERAIIEAATSGVQSVVGPQGLTGPQGLVGPQGPGVPGALLAGVAEKAIGVVLPQAAPQDRGLFDIGAGNKVLLGLGLVAAIVFLGKKK